MISVTGVTSTKASVRLGAEIENGTVIVGIESDSSPEYLSFCLTDSSQLQAADVTSVFSAREKRL